MGVKDGIEKARSALVGPSGLQELQTFLKANPQASEENFAKAKELLAKVDKKDISAAIEEIKTVWKDADKEKISALLTEIEASNGFSLARLESNIEQAQAKALFKLYKGLATVYLKTTPEFASFDVGEKEVLSVIGWRLIIDELSITGFLKSAIGSNIPSVGSEDDILALGEKVLSTPDVATAQTGTPDQTKTEIVKKMKEAFDKVKDNIVALGKLEAEQRKKIFAAPNVLSALVKTGEFKDASWDIKLSENRIITPELTQADEAGLKSSFIETLGKDTNATFKNNERIGKYISGFEKLTGTKLEDLLGSIWFIGPILAAIVTGLKKILGFKDTGENPDIAGTIDDSVKKSLEGLAKYAVSDEGKKVQNISFLSSLNEEKGKDFFKFLKDTQVDVTSENFWPLILSGKLANGQDGTAEIAKNPNLSKLQKFMGQTLTSSTNADECLAKLSKIRESDEFKETKTLAQVVEESINNGSSFPLKITYNNKETIINIEPKNDGVIVLIGEKKMKLSTVLIPLAGGASLPAPVTFTNISFETTGKLKLSYIKDSKEESHILNSNGEIIKIVTDLIGLNKDSYTSGVIEVTQENGTKTPVTFGFTKAA